MSDGCMNKGDRVPAWEDQIFAITEVQRLRSEFRFCLQVLVSELEQVVTSFDLRAVELLSFWVIKFFNKQIRKSVTLEQIDIYVDWIFLSLDTVGEGVKTRHQIIIFTRQNRL